MYEKRLWRNIFINLQNAKNTFLRIGE